METGQPATGTFYERIGGGPALQLAVADFYELVLGDEELNGFFTETDMAQLKKHQAALLTSVLGGPSAYEGRDMVDAHAGLGITERQFLLVRDYLLSVLWKLHVPVDIIEAVSSTVSSLRGSIVTA
ncbi:MAG TPA: group 1 truncated hemoglobin [Actinospica sp.]|nr:group 1 truncated hemoglobin [Actinospica sp.]